MHYVRGDGQMKIEIEKNTYIESDSNQFMIRKYSDKPTINKDGEEVYSFATLGYYGSLEHLANGLVRKKLLESNTTSFSELISEVKQIRQDISVLLRGD